MIGGEGTTYGLMDERGCRLVIVYAGRWVVGRKEGMLTVCVIVTFRTQLGGIVVRSASVVQEAGGGEVIR